MIKHKKIIHAYIYLYTTFLLSDYDTHRSRGVGINEVI